MSAYLKSAGFSALVCWEMTKRYALALKFSAYKFFACGDEHEARRAIWGKSAPSLDQAPVPLRRPISQRIVQAWTVSAGDRGDCTEALRTFVDTQNQLDRADVFHNELAVFSPTVDALVVSYKNGMRKYAVVYKSDIVFPPSTARPADQCGKVFTAIFNYIDDPEKTADVTKIVQPLSGPCRDFYVGSTYETTVEDVILFEKLFSSADCNPSGVHSVTLTTAEGLYMTFRRDQTLSEL